MGCSSDLKVCCQASFIGIAVFFLGTLFIIVGFAAPIWTSVSCRLYNENSETDIGYLGLFTECYPSLISGDLNELKKYSSCSSLSVISCSGSVGSPSWQTSAKILLCLALIGCILIGAFSYKTRCKMPKKGKARKKKTSILGLIMICPGFLGLIGDIIYGASESSAVTQYGVLVTRRRLAWAYIVSIVGCILILVAGILTTLLDQVVARRQAQRARGTKRRLPTRGTVSPSSSSAAAPSLVKISSLSTSAQTHATGPAVQGARAAAGGGGGGGGGGDGNAAGAAASGVSSAQSLAPNGSRKENRSDSPPAGVPFVVSGGPVYASDARGAAGVGLEASGSAPYATTIEVRPSSSKASPGKDNPLDEKPNGGIRSAGKGSVTDVRSQSSSSSSDVSSASDMGSRADVKSSRMGSSVDVRSTGKGSSADVKQPVKDSSAGVKSTVRSPSIGSSASVKSPSRARPSTDATDDGVTGPFVISGRPMAASEVVRPEVSPSTAITSTPTDSGPVSIVAAWGDGSAAVQQDDVPAGHAHSPVSSLGPRTAKQDSAGPNRVNPLYVDEYEPVVNT